MAISAVISAIFDCCVGIRKKLVYVRWRWCLPLPNVFDKTKNRAENMKNGVAHLRLLALTLDRVTFALLHTLWYYAILVTHLGCYTCGWMNDGTPGGVQVQQRMHSHTHWKNCDFPRMPVKGPCPGPWARGIDGMLVLFICGCGCGCGCRCYDVQSWFLFCYIADTNIAGA